MLFISGILAFRLRHCCKQEIVVSLPAATLKHDCADNLKVDMKKTKKNKLNRMFKSFPDQIEDSIKIFSLIYLKSTLNYC